MNYLVLNDNEFFKNIQLSNFREVQIDDRNRVDGIFGTITNEVLEHRDKLDGERDNLLREEWLCRDSGIIFVVLRVPQDILYDGTGESIERCLRVFNPKDVYVEMGAIKLEDKKNTYEYFLIAYNKKLGFKLFFDEKFLEKSEYELIPFICEKIEKKIL